MLEPTVMKWPLRSAAVTMVAALALGTGDLAAYAAEPVLASHSFAVTDTGAVPPSDEVGDLGGAAVIDPKDIPWDDMAKTLHAHPPI